MSPRLALAAAAVALALPIDATAAPMITQVNQVFIGNAPAGGTITVTGHADGSNFYRDGRRNASYDGEGYNVGPPLAGGGVGIYNLTAYNGMPFFINDRFGSGSDRIVAKFSFPIYSVSFDYEIFPNAQMANGSNVPVDKRATTRGWPDFTFVADGQTVFRALGVMPGEQTMPGYAKPFTSSPNNAVELAPQYIGSSGTILFPDGVNKLEFIDWPPVIGLGNVQFSAVPLNATPPAPTPEPASAVTWLLCAAAFGGLASRYRRRAVPAV